MTEVRSRKPQDPRTWAATARGWTFVELLVVLVFVAALAGTILGGFNDTARSGARETTEATLVAIRDAIVGRAPLGARPTGGFRADNLRDPTFIADLLRKPSDCVPFDPTTGIGWRGPYVTGPVATFQADAVFTEEYGVPGDPVLLDGWNRPIVLQVPVPGGEGAVDPADERYARLVSAGPNGVIDTPRDAWFPPLAQCGDDLVLYVHVTDQRK